MKATNITFIIALLLIGCSKSTNNSEFIQNVTGRYLFNPDSVIEVYFKNDVLYLKWNNAEGLKPLQLDSQTFYAKEMNEKIQFLINPKDGLRYICLVPKNKKDSITYNFKKLGLEEKLPNEFFKNKEYEKALEGYLAIQQKDSLNKIIKERRINSWGYSEVRNKNYDIAVEVFKLNVALYPESSNVYDSYAEALFKKNDTLGAVENYKKSLQIDSGNPRAKKFVKKYDSH